MFCFRSVGADRFDPKEPVTPPIVVGQSENLARKKYPGQWSFEDRWRIAGSFC